MSHPAATTVFDTIHKCLREDERTREPLNALVVWTELGKGLAGTLEQVGAEPGLLRTLIAGYCRSDGREVDLARWAYRLEGKDRLGKVEAGMALRKIQAALEDALPELAAESTTSDEARKKFFLEVVRGWFPVGLDIVRAFPAAKGAADEEARAALGAWCERYLPKAGVGAAELGVRVERD